MGDAPIRILRVIARLNVGGPALHVSYLSSELDAIGYRTVLVAGEVSPGEGTMEQIALARGVDLRSVGGLKREIDPLKDIVAVARLVRLMRAFRPQILHTHTAKAGALGRTAALLAGRGRPQVVVHTYHGHVLSGYFGDRANAMFRLLERLLAKVSDALIAVSPEVRDDLVRYGVAPASRIVVVRLGLDLEARTAAPAGARECERERLGVAEGAFLIGWVGRMTEIKRVEDLLAAFALVCVAGLDAHLALVGDGPLQEPLRELARELGVEQRCHFLGYTDEVGPLYRAFDVAVLSSANEGTPVTLIEALAAGVPAVATDVGGVGDVVEDGETGLLVAPGAPAELAAALLGLGRDPELRQRFAAAAAASVNERYALRRLVADLDELYRRLLAERGTGRPRLLRARR